MKRFKGEEMRFVAKELLRTQKPVFDYNKGFINPIKLKISKDTLGKLQERKEV